MPAARSFATLAAFVAGSLPGCLWAASGATVRIGDESWRFESVDLRTCDVSTDSGLLIEVMGTASDATMSLVWSGDDTGAAYAEMHPTGSFPFWDARNTPVAALLRLDAQDGETARFSGTFTKRGSEAIGEAEEAEGSVEIDCTI